MRKLIYILSLLTLILLNSYKPIDGLLDGNFTTVQGIPTDYVAFYKFDSTFNDETGNYDGTNNGMLFATDRNGGTDSCTEANNSSDYVSIPYQLIQTATEFSIFTWVYYSSIGSAFGSIINRFTGATGTNTFTFGIDPSSSSVLRVWVNNFSASVTYGDTTLLSDTWYHAGFTYSESAQTITIYLDGVQNGQRTGITSTISSGTTNISINSNVTNIQLIGYHDQAKFYDRVLTQTEITALYGE